MGRRQIIKQMMCVVTWLFLSAFSVTNAIPKRDVENLCRETTDAAFCVTHIETDPRTPAARDLKDVLTIVISLTKIQVDDATTHLTSVRRQFNGPNGRRRINGCKTNYVSASNSFQTSWEKAINNMFAEANKLAIAGNNAVIACENGWKQGGPVQQSPLTKYNTNVNNLYSVISVLVRKLGA